MIVMAYDLLLC